MTAKKTFDLAELDSTDRYKLMSGLIVPRPIGWVGSVDRNGNHNLAPFSFFNMVAGTPPTVLFVTGTRQRIKDTLSNVRETGEFTLNTVSEDVAARMVQTAGEYDPTVDEFALSGLTPVLGDRIQAPMVAEAPAAMECQVTQVLDIGDPPTAAVVFGEVLALHVDEAVLDGTRIDHDVLKAVGRMAGQGYTTTRDRFDQSRPQ